MGDPPSFDDRFGRRSTPGKGGFGAGQDRFRKEPASPKPAKPPKLLKPEKIAKPKTSAAKPDAFASQAKPKAKSLKALAPPPAAPAPARDPFTRAPLRPAITRSGAPLPSAPTPSQPPPAPKPAMAKPGGFYNPFERPRPAAPAPRKPESQAQAEPAAPVMAAAAAGVAAVSAAEAMASPAETAETAPVAPEPLADIADLSPTTAEAVEASAVPEVVAAPPPAEAAAPVPPDAIETPAEAVPEPVVETAAFAEQAPPEAAPFDAAPPPAVEIAPAEAAAAETAHVDAEPVAPAVETPPPAAETAAPASPAIELVEATVEPSYTSPDVQPPLYLGRMADPGPTQPVAAFETSWQAVSDDPATTPEPTAGKLEKVETSLTSNYWGGGGSSDGASPPRRGFNQDDVFGVIFGLAVIVFLLMWLMRGEDGEAGSVDPLFGPQSASTDVTATPPPPPVDPFGNAPVDLKPTGPIPEPLPVDPETAIIEPPPPPPVDATPPPPPPITPEPVLPLAQRKMHAWFCTASSRLTRVSRTELNGELDKFAEIFAGQELVVRGYADTRGSIELNEDLGARRAQTVADFLTKKGLSVVDVQGVGELDGLDDNQNCPNQRRVDVWVKGGPAETPSRSCTPEPDVERLICG